MNRLCRMTEICPTTREPLYSWLALERVPNVGPITMARLRDAFGDPATSLAASADEIQRRAGLSAKLSRAVASFLIPHEAVRADIDLLDRIGCRVVTRWDDDYPANLGQIYDPPALLFVRGEFGADIDRCVAVVGTRNPTRYGLDMTESITRDLVAAGITIVSGLARGIDTCAHQAALKRGGRTVGVLGCGIDVVYPKENRDLIEETAEAGAVVTEFRPGVRPLATNFFRRNRIVSGLSQAVLVVEAGKTSGSLITANHALDQNRDVFAVPGNVMNMRSRGPHHLIKQGAGLVESAADILEAVFQAPSSSVQPSLFESFQSAKDLSAELSKVLEALEPDPIPIDMLCESLDMPSAVLAGLLLELELKGLVRQFPGKLFARVSG